MDVTILDDVEPIEVEPVEEVQSVEVEPVEEVQKVEVEPAIDSINYEELVNTLLQSVQGVGTVDNEDTSASDTLADSADDLEDNESGVPVFQNLIDVESVEAAGATVPSRAVAELPVIGTVEPDDLLFYGCVWIHGVDSQLGEITLYFPTDTKNDWGLDRAGHLVYLGSSGSSGYLDSVYNNSLTLSAFSAPRYRLSNASSWSYLSFVPDNSNAPIAVSSAPRVGLFDALPLFVAAMLGVVVLFLSRSRH